MVKKKPMGYWKSLDNTLAEARKLIKENNLETLPNSRKLGELRYGGLSDSISRYHGGFHKFRKLLGEQPKRREVGLWQNLDYTVEQAKKCMEENNFEALPNGDKLKELGYSSLSMAITKYHSGFHKFRKLLGEQPKRTENGLWKDLDYTIKQAREFMEEHGFETLPNQGKLQEMSYSGLVNSIHAYHGGFHKFRKLLGEKQRKRENGLWKSLDYTIEQAQKCMEELGVDTLPGWDKLIDEGYSSLPSAIARHHGGLRNFRKLIGEQPKRTEPGLWKDLDYTIQQAKKIMEELGVETLPSQKILGSSDYSGLSNAIIKYHGGFPQFRAILQDIKIPSKKEKLEFMLRRYVE